MTSVTYYIDLNKISIKKKRDTIKEYGVWFSWTLSIVGCCSINYVFGGQKRLLGRLMRVTDLRRDMAEEGFNRR